MNAPLPRTSALRLIRAGLAAFGAAGTGSTSTPPEPVLVVIANHDFDYAEYAAVRASLEALGLAVTVVAGDLCPAMPQDPGVDMPVRPQHALSDVRSAGYSALVFVGGWGASAYQYAFMGTYSNPAYRPGRQVAREANRLICEFVAEDKPVAGVGDGVTVLAWARVDGSSPLRDRAVAGSTRGGPGFRFAGHEYRDTEVPARSHFEINGVTLPPAAAPVDDARIDGRFVTAGNHLAAERFARLLAQSIAAGSGHERPSWPQDRGARPTLCLGAHG